MAKIARIGGLSVVLRNLDLQSARVALGVARGLKTAGLLLQRESQKMVPVEFGPLKASAFTRSTGAGFTTVVTVGYTAVYALYVHEAVGMVLKGQPREPSPPHIGHYWDPQGQAAAKFLEEPAKRLSSRIRKLVHTHARL